jgi:hypothetical protein
VFVCLGGDVDFSFSFFFGGSLEEGNIKENGSYVWSVFFLIKVSFLFYYLFYFIF